MAPRAFEHSVKKDCEKFIGSSNEETYTHKHFTYVCAADYKPAKALNTGALAMSPVTIFLFAALPSLQLRFVCRRLWII
jgi:hypothetical protein